MRLTLMSLALYHAMQLGKRGLDKEMCQITQSYHVPNADMKIRTRGNW